jgi:C_GCAxxG_C_C family probable redox protein
MRNLAIYFHNQGYNCSRCIIMAAAEKFGFPLPQEVSDCCCGVNNGFGVGTICSALVGSVMVFGILFSEEKTKLMRLELFIQFQEKYGGLNCCMISACREDCDDVIGDIAELTEKLILKYKT